MVALLIRPGSLASLPQHSQPAFPRNRSGPIRRPEIRWVAGRRGTAAVLQWLTYSETRRARLAGRSGSEWLDPPPRLRRTVRRTIDAHVDPAKTTLHPVAI